jgi:hypothetical protein
MCALNIFLWMAWFTTASASFADDEKVVGTPPETRPSTIHQYEKSDSVSPKSKNSKAVVPTNPLDQAASADERGSYATEVTRAIEAWGPKIDDLRTRAATDPRKQSMLQSAIFLEKMRDQARADLNELPEVKKGTWVDVKARLEARFQKMKKELAKYAAE